MNTATELVELTSFDETKGKRIDRIHAPYMESFAILFFDDGTYLTIEVDRGWDSDLGLIAGSMKERSDSYKVEAGLMPKEEFEKRRAEQEAASQKQREAYERRQYEQLKRKFGDS